jgi:sporulation protein YlmC with PRC-barrel domain
MRLKELRGLPVIDPTAARKIGTITDYQVDPGSGRLAALDVGTAGGEGGERILAQRIRRVGHNAVILTARGGATAGAPVEVNERWLDASTLTGLEVMGDDGNCIGRLVDAAFDQETLEIEAYLLRANGWRRMFGARNRIQPAKVHSCSRELMMMTTGRLKEAPAISSAEETTLRIPLKAEDRLPAPSFDAVPDGRPVGARPS